MGIGGRFCCTGPWASLETGAADARWKVIRSKAAKGHAPSHGAGSRQAVPSPGEPRDHPCFIIYQARVPLKSLAKAEARFSRA